MPNFTSVNSNTYIPSTIEATLAKHAGPRLSQLLKPGMENIVVSFANSSMQNQSAEVPAAAIRFFLEILERMALGQPLQLTPLHAELTTQQAANLLATSRPFLVRLLDEGVIPFRKVGTHRRVLAKDIIEYKANQELKRLKNIEALSELQQNLGLDD